MTKEQFIEVMSAINKHFKLNFICSSSFWDFSADDKTETLDPDIEWDVDYVSEFSEKELNDMITLVKEREWTKKQ